MVLIKDTKGRRANETASGYERVTGNKQLGQLISKYHATAIRTGNELEKILESKLVGRIDIAIRKLNRNKRIFKNLKTDSSGKKHDVKVDMVIEQNNEVTLVEVKDGDTFDTKKVAGEIESLNLAKEHLQKQGKSVSVKFCSFNAIGHEQIEKGAKGLLESGMAMTGRELCELLGLDFDKIVEERKTDQQENLDFFVDELIKIPTIKGKLSENI